ncbi:MAG: hypothetical protein WB762_15925 [Candidatus Sulfotelmatobacter sp.]
MSLKTKFRIIERMAGAGLATLAGFCIQSEYSRILQDKEEPIRDLGDMPFSSSCSSNWKQPANRTVSGHKITPGSASGAPTQQRSAPRFVGSRFPSATVGGSSSAGSGGQRWRDTQTSFGPSPDWSLAQSAHA